ncbi:MAG TPA: hypothetical protein VHM91_23650, partial [Verrucomicrobiales bacterium]|nr:hypothetical protein [Verrucomicrobiales bacterium]
MNEKGKVRRPSILRRITLVSWLVAVMSVGVFALFTILHMRSTKERELEQRSRALAEKIEHEIAQHLAEQNFGPVVKHCLDMLRREPGLKYVVIKRPPNAKILHYIDDGGKPRWTDEEGDADASLAAAGGEHKNFQVAPDGWNGKIWNYHHSASFGANQVGDIALGLSMQEYDDSIRAIYQNVGTTAAVVLVIGVIAAYSVARNLIRPLRALQLFASKVT